MNAQKSGATNTRLSIVAKVLLFYLCSLAVLMFTSGVAKSLPKQVADLISIGTATLLTLGLVLIFTRWTNYRTDDVGLVPGKLTVKHFITGFMIGLSMAVIQAVAVAGISHHLKLIYSPGFGFTTILPAILLYLLIACREELVFRSYSLRMLDKATSPTIAVTVMVSIFVLEHIISGVPLKIAIPGIGLGGILFSIAALKTKGLALPLGLHFSWNFGQWITGFKNTPGIFNATVDKGYETQTENLGLIVYALLMLLAILGVIIFYRKKSAL